MWKSDKVTLFLYDDPEVYLRDMLKGYPATFHSRADVLFHLFYIKGNGTQWVHGVPAVERRPQVFSPYDEQKRLKKASKKWIGEKQAVKALLMKEMDKILDISAMSYMAGYASQVMEFRKFDPNRHTGLDLMMTYPPDISKAWLHEADKIKLLVEGVDTRGRIG